METQSLLVQETSEENHIAPAGASQAQDTAQNSAVETRAVGREAEGDGNDGESDPGEWNRLLRNAAAKLLCAEYSAAIKEEKGEDIVEEEDVFEYRKQYIARLDAWIMTVLEGLGFEEACGG